jgi:hypothetical protein
MEQQEAQWKRVFVVYAVVTVLSIFIGSNTESYFWEDLFGYLWIGGGIVGLILLGIKGQLLRFGVLSCALWLLVGWWAIILLIIFGPLTWLVALFIEPKAKCKNCREVISAKASICPKCNTPNPTEK